MINDQLSLDDLPPSAQSTGPGTFWASDRETRKDKAKLGRQLAAVLRVISRAGDGGAICHSIATVVGNESSRVARRITDLVELGLVEDTGQTKVAPTKRAQTLWRLTGAGRMEVARLTAAEARRGVMSDNIRVALVVAVVVLGLTVMQVAAYWCEARRRRMPPAGRCRVKN